MQVSSPTSKASATPLKVALWRGRADAAFSSCAVPRQASQTAPDGFLLLADRGLFKCGGWGLAVLLSLHLMGGIRLLLIEFGSASGLRKNRIAAAAGFAWPRGSRSPSRCCPDFA